MVKEAVSLNGISQLALMKMDVLDGLKKVKICLAYEYKGKRFKRFPYDLEVLKNARPVYQEVPGWERMSAKPKSYGQLHPNAKAYLERLADILHVKITMISLGSAREETLFIKK
jgi:adenylosuccinate synthase